MEFKETITGHFDPIEIFEEAKEILFEEHFILVDVETLGEVMYFQGAFLQNELGDFDSMISFIQNEMEFENEIYMAEEDILNIIQIITVQLSKKLGIYDKIKEDQEYDFPFLTMYVKEDEE